MPSLFVSRALAADSPIRKWAERRGLDLFAQSLLSFKALPFVLPSEAYDWVFFYSPRAVQYFFGARPLLPKGVRLGAVGKGTAAAIERQGRVVDFCGAGSPEVVASDFGTLAKGERVLFPSAANSRRSVATLLAEQITALELVVYDNEPAAPTSLPSTDVVVLTSPMNAQAYFASCPAHPETIYLAIGSVTARAMAAFGVEAQYPPVAEEEALCILLDRWAVG